MPSVVNARLGYDEAVPSQPTRLDTPHAQPDTCSPCLHPRLPK
ncbi:hypothetical protein GFS31_18630 [Leptolyngbya sp. BL0902]|nr:hypothetical protein GFS31_18630 [Leptolyngbya sp. BL0902]